MNQSSSPSSVSHSVTAISITNGVLGLLLVGMLGAFLYFEFAYEPEVEPADMEPYVQEVKQRLDQHADVISAEAAALASDTLPPLSNAIYEQTKEDYSLYLRTLQNQGDEYLANTEDMLVAKVQAKYRDYLRAHAQVLQEEFPEHASEQNVERVLAEFEHTFDRIAQRYYVQEFRTETKRTKRLWSSIEPVAQPGPNEPSLGEQLADYTADWTIIALAEESTAEDESAAEQPAPAPADGQSLEPPEEPSES